MKELRIYRCDGCPFLKTKLPVSGTILFDCGLIDYLKLKLKKTIKNISNTPKWCPLRKEEEIIIQFREMSKLIFLQNIVEKLKEIYHVDKVYLDDIYNQIYFEYKNIRVDIQRGDNDTFWVSAANMSTQCKKSELLICINRVIQLKMNKNNN
jgi:hypothetical protein